MSDAKRNISPIPVKTHCKDKYIFFFNPIISYMNRQISKGPQKYSLSYIRARNSFIGKDVAYIIRWKFLDLCSTNFTNFWESWVINNEKKSAWYASSLLPSYWVHMFPRDSLTMPAARWLESVLSRQETINSQILILFRLQSVFSNMKR